MVDSAHNADSAQKLAQTLNEVFPRRRWAFVFSTLTDKDVPGMLAALQPLAVRWVMTEFAHPRAWGAAALRDAAHAQGVKAESRALADALRVMLEEDVPVCVFGSVAFAGKMRSLWSKATNTPLPFTEEDELA